MNRSRTKYETYSDLISISETEHKVENAGEKIGSFFKLASDT